MATVERRRRPRSYDELMKTFEVTDPAIIEQERGKRQERMKDFEGARERVPENERLRWDALLRARRLYQGLPEGEVSLAGAKEGEGRGVVNPMEGRGTNTGAERLQEILFPAEPKDTGAQKFEDMMSTADEDPVWRKVLDALKLIHPRLR